MNLNCKLTTTTTRKGEKFLFCLLLIFRTKYQDVWYSEEFSIYNYMLKIEKKHASNHAAKNTRKPRIHNWIPEWQLLLFFSHSNKASENNSISRHSYYYCCYHYYFYCKLWKFVLFISGFFLSFNGLIQDFEITRDRKTLKMMKNNEIQMYNTWIRIFNR